MKKIIRIFTILIMLCVIAGTSKAHALSFVQAEEDNSGKYTIPKRANGEVVKHIRKISILHGTQIRRIHMEWTDENGVRHFAPRKRQTPGPGEKWVNIFLKKDEYIIRATGLNSKTVSRLKLYTNKGNVYGPFAINKSRGRPFNFKTRPGYRINGFIVSFKDTRYGKSIASFGVTKRRYRGIGHPRPPMTKPWRTIFNFNEEAPSARWETTILGDQSGTFHRVPFGKNMKRKGSAYLIEDVLENRTKKTALFTHPRWARNGTIRGYFPKTPRLPANAKLKGKLGFASLGSNSKTTGVKFLIYIHYMENGREKSEQLFKYFKKYTGNLKSINIDLSKYAGKKVSFELRVDAGKSATEDWAIWDSLRVQARL